MGQVSFCVCSVAWDGEKIEKAAFDVVMFQDGGHQHHCDSNQRPKGCLRCNQSS